MDAVAKKRMSEIKEPEVGSAIFFGGALSLECYFFFTSASARSQRFQIWQCAKRYSAIAEASARRYPPPPGGGGGI